MSKSLFDVSAMSSSVYQCTSSIADFNGSASDADGELSSGSRSVRNAVATFECHQQRQLGTTSAPRSKASSGSRMASRSTSVSSSSNVARLKAAHQRNASDDFTQRGTLVLKVVSTGNDEESTSSDSGQEQSIGRSVAELRAALQKSAGLNLEGDREEFLERPGHRRIHDVHESTFRPLGELKASLNQSLENIAGESGWIRESRQNLASEARERAPSERSDATKDGENPKRKPCPKVLPKPNIKRLPKNIVEVKSTRRKSVGSDCESSDDLMEVNGAATEHCRTELNTNRLSENPVDCHLGNLSDVSLHPKVEVLKSSPSIAQDPNGQLDCLGELFLSSSENFEDIHRTPESGRDCFISHRKSSHCQKSQNSSRTSSNLSACSLSANVETSIDEDTLGMSDPFHLSQADSGISMCESSYEESPSSSGDLNTVKLVVDLESSASGKLYHDQVSAMLRITYGQSSDDLCQIMCDWATYKTALDYVGNSFAENSRVLRYHTNLTSLFCHGAASRVQYLSLEALMEAVHQNISEKRSELLAAKAAVAVDSVTMKQLETKVSSAIKAKAADSRKYEKFLVSYNELDKVTQLLLMLSSRLSRIDNSTSKLIGPSTNNNRMESLMSRRDELLKKLEDARLLKMDIDRRSKVLTSALVTSLDHTECIELDRLVSERCRLSLQLQEINDWMRLVDEHLAMISLKRSSSSSSGSVSVC